MLRAKNLIAEIIICLVGSAILPAGVSADCGSVPFYSPILDPIEIVKNVIPAGKNDAGSDSRSLAKKAMSVQFDPLKVSIFEPKQRAIILWNGEEEILLLSTDQRASQQSAVLEVIPLPAEPKVKAGSFETFEKAQRLVVEKRMWATAHGGAAAQLVDAEVQKAGRITFQEKIGAHDIAVANVINKERFVEFVQSYLNKRYQTQQAPIRPDFVSVIDSYLKEGFQWFAFDVISLDGTTKSREPIEYRFASESVFYPLRISSLEKGKTEVDLLVFTAKGASQFLGLNESRIKRDPQVAVTLAEMEGLNAGWKGFFPASTALVTMDQWGVKGESSKLLVDVRAK